MGISKLSAQQQLKNRDQIYDLAWNHLSDDNDGTNVCVSLIPKRDTMPDIKNQIYRAIMHNVYPLIGELEEAGFCVGKTYECEKVSQAELLELKAWIREYFGWDYEVPICPAVFGAVHINHCNLVTVGRDTGMSCSWPNMIDPDPYELCDFRGMPLPEIVKLILDYRLDHISNVVKLAQTHHDTVFGGCGGQAQRIFDAYLNSYRDFCIEKSISV